MKVLRVRFLLHLILMVKLEIQIVFIFMIWQFQEPLPFVNKGLFY